MHGVKTGLFYTYKLQNILFTVSWPSPAQSQNCLFIRRNSTRSLVKKMYSREKNDFVKYVELKTLLIVSGIGQNCQKCGSSLKKIICQNIIKSHPWQLFRCLFQLYLANMTFLPFLITLGLKIFIFHPEKVWVSTSLAESRFGDS